MRIRRQLERDGNPIADLQLIEPLPIAEQTEAMIARGANRAPRRERQAIHRLDSG